MVNVWYFKNLNIYFVRSWGEHACMHAHECALFYRNMLKKVEPVSTSLWFPTAARRCLVTQIFHSQKIIQTMCQILYSWNISKCMQNSLIFWNAFNLRWDIKYQLVVRKHSPIFYYLSVHSPRFCRWDIELARLMIPFLKDRVGNGSVETQ
jgi:hypothetical protein